MDEKALTERIHHANQAVAFLNSDVGQYVQKKINERLIDCTTSLAGMDVTDTKALMQLQIEMKSLQNVMTVLAEIINEGDDAEFELKQGRDEIG
jgi:hypothetical protein